MWGKTVSVCVCVCLKLPLCWEWAKWQCVWKEWNQHKTTSHTQLRLTKNMSKHWAWKAKRIFVYVDACMVCLLSLIYTCACMYITMQAFGCSIQKAEYCAHNKDEDKLLWIWQLNDSSTVRLEENRLVKVFTEITSNAWLLTAATKTPIPRKKERKQRKQCTMVLNPVKIFQVCSIFLTRSSSFLCT